MTKNSAFGFLGCGLIVTGCSSGAQRSDVSTDPQEVIGGTVDRRDPAVVMLLKSTEDADYTCTASFISTTVLLTAGHCVVDDNDPKTVTAAAKFRILLGPEQAHATPGSWIDVRTTNVHVHPRYDGDATHDVAVLVLDKPAPVKPLAIKLDAGDLGIGGKVRIVGYGQSVRGKKSGKNDGAGTKRERVVSLRGLQGDLLLIGNTGGQACDGDSGGPALMELNGVETIIGTDDLAALSGQNNDCKGGDLYQRTDANSSFLRPFLMR